jgi:ADP-dependent NAD(P)H-hydrate dehydratase / NAD(P)H-hydrate epimerase
LAEHIAVENSNRQPLVEPLHANYLSRADVATWLPIRLNGRDVNKGTFGHVIVFAGSIGFAGAPILVSEAAARAGSGLVTLAIPEGLQQAVMSRVSPIVMTSGLAQSLDGTFAHAAIEPAITLIRKATAVAIGPGIGDGEDLAEFVGEIIAGCPVPLVIDADALNILAKKSDQGASLTKRRKAPTILTPHPGEMGRLLGCDIQTIQNDRQGAIRLATEKFGCVVLLKGDHTLVTCPHGDVYINMTGNAGMATGGMGDVLTGVLAALLAQRLPPWKAAALGAYIHGLAGDMVACQLGGTTGIIATDVIARLPQAIAHCQMQA